MKQENTGTVVELWRVIRDRAPGKFGWWRVLLSITASGSCLSHRISRFEKICELAGSSCYLRWNRIRDSIFDIGYHKWISCRSARPCCDPPRKVSSVLEPCKYVSCVPALATILQNDPLPPLRVRRNYIYLFIRKINELTTFLPLEFIWTIFHFLEKLMD